MGNGTGAYQSDPLDVPHFYSIWSALSAGGPYVTKSNLKRFIKRFSPDFPSLVDWSEESRDQLSFEEFEELFIFLCIKSRIPLTPGFENLFIPRNSAIMEKFREYTKIPFEEEKHNHLVCKLWRKAFNEESPEIPSKKWSELGFQGTNPSTDFRGAGLFGIECLLALAKHKELFSFIKKSSEEHEIPFSTAGINVVMIIYDFLGWGFKAPGIPSGRSLFPFRNLYRILFDVDDIDEDNPENLFNRSKWEFWKVFFITFGTMENIWRKVNARYMDFPEVLTRLTIELEEILNELSDRSTLDHYLMTNFKDLINFSILQPPDSFWIGLPTNHYKILPLNQEFTLADLLKDISLESQITIVNCSGDVMESVDIPLDHILERTVYVLAKEIPRDALLDAAAPPETPHGSRLSRSRQKMKMFIQSPLPSPLVSSTPSRRNLKALDLIREKSSPNLPKFRRMVPPGKELKRADLSLRRLPTAELLHTPGDLLKSPPPSAKEKKGDMSQSDKVRGSHRSFTTQIPKNLAKLGLFTTTQIEELVLLSPQPNTAKKKPSDDNLTPELERPAEIVAISASNNAIMEPKGEQRVRIEEETKEMEDMLRDMAVSNINMETTEASFEVVKDEINKELFLASGEDQICLDEVLKDMEVEETVLEFLENLHNTITEKVTLPVRRSKVKPRTSKAEFPLPESPGRVSEELKKPRRRKKSTPEPKSSKAASETSLKRSKLTKTRSQGPSRKSSIKSETSPSPPSRFEEKSPSARRGKHSKRGTDSSSDIVKKSHSKSKDSTSPTIKNKQTPSTSQSSEMMHSPKKTRQKERPKRTSKARRRISLLNNNTNLSKSTPSKASQLV